MDLKAYAIERKLAGHGDLLAYVTKGQAIPIDVIDQNFQNVLANRHDDTAELLSTDYRKYLHQEVKMNFVKASASQMQVSGNIDDNVVDIIEAVHHVNRHEIVKETVEDVMSDFNPHDTVKFDQIELYKDAENFVNETTQGQTINSTAQATKEPLEEETKQTETPVKEVDETPAEQVTSAEQTEQTQPKVNATQFDNHEMNDLSPETGFEHNDMPDLPEDTIDEDVPPTIPDEYPDTTFMDATLPESKLDSTSYENATTPSNAMAGGVGPSNAGTNAQSQNVVANAYHQAYDYFRDELKKYKLDDRLPGLNLD